MIDTNRNLFELMAELLAQPPVKEPGLPLPENAQVIAVMPEDLRPAASALMRVATERVRLAREIKATEQELPDNDEPNPVRWMRNLLSRESERTFDELLRFEQIEHRLESLQTTLLLPFFSELRARIPGMMRVSRAIQITDKWEIFDPDASKK